MRILFEQFVRDGLYLKGVSARTENWYWQSWTAYSHVLQDCNPGDLDKGSFLSRIEEMRTRGVSPITINTYSRAINAFLRWLHQEGHSPALVQVPRLKEEQKVMPTLTADQIRRLVEYKPKGLNGTRAWALAMVALDTGLRLNEALSLRRDELDFDNLLITGKAPMGRKPYGFYEGEGEPEVLERTKALRAAGMGFDRIAGAPNAEGVKPRSGERWWGKTVNKILVARWQ